MIESATAAAKARGWTVETYDGNGDQVATNNQANTFITRGFDALINIASDNNQMGGVIANAAKAKIPFVSTFSGMVPGITVDIGSNNVADGVFSASELVARINGEGEVLKMNWTVLPALQERDAGFHAVMNEYKKVKVTEMEIKVPGQVDDYVQQDHRLSDRPQGREGDLDGMGRSRRRRRARGPAVASRTQALRRQHGRQRRSV